MTRDPQQFPADKNGDALWQMLEQGDKLHICREIEFSTAFAQEEQALAFAQEMLINRQKVLLIDVVDDNYPFEVLVIVEMAPNYEEICGYEGLLAQYFEPLAGVSAGWFAPALDEQPS